MSLLNKNQTLPFAFFQSPDKAWTKGEFFEIFSWEK